MTRTEWILGILLAVLLIFIVAFGLIFWLQPGSDNNSNVAAVAPTSPFTGHTAVRAYLLAQAEAAKWQPDAGLLKASATWPQGANQETLLQGKTTWTFTFYSPGSEMTAVVTVVNEAATLGSTRPAAANLSALDTGSWKIDSNEAIQSFLNSGGSEFLRQNGVSTLTVSLSKTPEGNRTEWFLSLFSVSNGRSYTASIDPTSGDILNVINTP